MKQSPQAKALSKSAGKEYIKGFSKGDLLKHKRENLKLTLKKGSDRATGLHNTRKIFG